MTKRELSSEAARDRLDYERDRDSNGCTCHFSPPCSICTHPGNPANQAEDDSCWLDEYPVLDSPAAAPPLALEQIAALERLVAHQSAEIESLRADNRKALSELQFAFDGSWEASITTQVECNNLIAERDSLLLERTTLSGQLERLSRAFLKYVTTF